MLIEVSLAYRVGDAPCLLCFDASAIRSIRDVSASDRPENTDIIVSGGTAHKVLEPYAEVKKEWEKALAGPQPLPGLTDPRMIAAYDAAKTTESAALGGA